MEREGIEREGVSGEGGERAGIERREGEIIWTQLLIESNTSAHIPLLS